MTNHFCHYANQREAQSNCGKQINGLSARVASFVALAVEEEVECLRRQRFLRRLMCVLDPYDRVEHGKSEQHHVDQPDEQRNEHTTDDERTQYRVVEQTVPGSDRKRNKC